MKYTKRHRIQTLENKLNIRTEINCKDYENSLYTSFKVWRLEDNNYVFDGIYTKEELLAEANRI